MYKYEEDRAPLKVRKIGDILAELAIVRGLGKTQTRSRLVEMWKQTAESFFPAAILKFTNPGEVRHGKLTIFINGNSTILQELSFHKQELLTKWNQLNADQQLKGLVFKQGK